VNSYKEVIDYKRKIGIRRKDDVHAKVAKEVSLGKVGRFEG